MEQWLWIEIDRSLCQQIPDLSWLSSASTFSLPFHESFLKIQKETNEQVQNKSYCLPLAWGRIQPASIPLLRRERETADRQRSTADCSIPLISVSSHPPFDLQFHIDMDSLFKRILFEEYAPIKPAATRFLPFHYHRIPAPLRIALGKQLYQHSRFPAFPGWPRESALEFFYQCLRYQRSRGQEVEESSSPEVQKSGRREVNRRSSAVEESGSRGVQRLEIGEQDGVLEKNSWILEPSLGDRWRGPHPLFVFLTHDCDTAEGQSLLHEFVRIEQQYGVHSVCFFPARHYWLNNKLLYKLKMNGFEIGLHGDTHDDKLPYLPEKTIDRRLESCVDLIEDFSIQWFRSPNLYRTPQLFRSIEKLFAYDSSIPDTSISGGCAFTRPFYRTPPKADRKSLLEIPITLPLDSELIMLGFPPEKILHTWIQKTEYLKQTGGMVNVCVHPEPHFSGNRAGWRVYEQFLLYLLEQGAICLTQPNFCA